MSAEASPDEGSLKPQSLASRLVLRGGHVVDPKNGISAVMDIAVGDGRVAMVAKSIPTQLNDHVVDVSGHYIMPGLLDLHVHLDPSFYAGGIVADAHSFCSGITTMVDAGSSGAACFEDFRERVVNRSYTRVFAFLNIVDAGMRGDVEQEVSRMRVGPAAEVAAQYPEVIVGIKGAHYWGWQPWDAEHPPWANIDRSVQAGELCNLPVMIHETPRPPERSYEDFVLRRLRPGDIQTHVFSQQFPVIGPDGMLNDILRQGRHRGVLFDVGHGGGSFWFRNAVPAVQQGFLPDTISSDLHSHSANGLANLPLTMSKFLNMGMSLEDVVTRVTTAPAHLIGHPELGNLDHGAEADIAVFRMHEGEFGFIDCGRARLRGSRLLECVLTLRAGEVAYDPGGVTMPDWQQAPDNYWALGKGRPKQKLIGYYW